MNHLNLWEDSIRKGLEHHEVTPPAMGWEKLEQALHAATAPTAPSTTEAPLQAPAKQGPEMGKTSSRSPRLRLPASHRWLWASAGTASVAAACMVIAMVMNRQNASSSSTPTLADHQQNDSVKHNGTLPQQVNSSGVLASVAHTVEKLEQTQRNVLPATQTAAVQHLALLSVPDAPNEGAPSADAEAETAVPSLASAQDAEKASGHAAAESANEGNPESSSAPQAHATPTRKVHTSPKGRIAEWGMEHTYPTESHLHGSRSSERAHMPHFALHMSASSSQLMNQKGTYYNPPALSSGNVTVMSMEQIEFAHIVGSNLDKQVESRVKHHTPFTAGINVSIPITSHWSIRTGLTYTLLTTDIQAGSSVAYYTTQQRLHYVGIPAAASYTIYDSRFLNVYGSLGMLVENCVKATRSTTFDNTDQRRSSQSKAEGFANGLWQLSANASAGVQLNLTRHVGLYFEPGVSYFIPDGSSLPNVRHEHPWNFNMQGGLRFSLGK